MDKREDMIRRGKAAALFLEDENVLNIIGELGNEWMEESYRGQTIENREEARYKLRSLDAIKAKLESIVANGRQAQRDIEK